MNSEDKTKEFDPNNYKYLNSEDKTKEFDPNNYKYLNSEDKTDFLQISSTIVITNDFNMINICWFTTIILLYPILSCLNVQIAGNRKWFN